METNERGATITATPTYSSNLFSNDCRKDTKIPAIDKDFDENLDADDVQVTDEQDEFELRLEKCRIRITDEYEEPEPLLRLGGATEDGDVPVFTRGNISMIQGKAKSRKTFLTILLIVCILEQHPNAHILIFDTEMGKYHARKRLIRILSLLGWEENVISDRMKLYALRELSTEERKTAVERLIDKEKPDFAVLDGVRDIIHDFNKVEESTDISDLLLRLSSEYTCHICNVLHENKNDTNARGHAGSELQNKAETVLSVSKDGDTTKVEAKYCRNPEFSPLFFRVNEYGLPEWCEAQATKPKKSKEELLRELVEPIFRARQTTEMSFANLQAAVMKTGGLTKKEGGIKERAAIAIIKDCVEFDILEKSEENGNTRYKYLFRQSETELSEEEDNEEFLS